MILQISDGFGFKFFDLGRDRSAIFGFGLENFP